jgi:hypothetical protein
MEVQKDSGFWDLNTRMLHPANEIIESRIFQLNKIAAKSVLTPADIEIAMSILNSVEMDMFGTQNLGSFHLTLIYFGAIDALVKLLKAKMMFEFFERGHPPLAPWSKKALIMLEKLLSHREATPKLARLARDGDFICKLIRLFKHGRTAPCAQSVLQFIVTHHREVLNLSAMPNIVADISRLPFDVQLFVCHCLSHGPQERVTPSKEFRYISGSNHDQQSAANQPIWLAVPNLILNTVRNLNSTSDKYDVLLPVLRMFLTGKNEQVSIIAISIIFKIYRWRRTEKYHMHRNAPRSCFIISWYLFERRRGYAPNSIMMCSLYVTSMH